MRSEWPPTYFVTLCTTASAPSASGRCSAGVAKVLSTTTRAPCSCAAALTAAMSTIFSIGFDGVSIHTSVVSGVIAPLDGAEVGEVDGREAHAPLAEHPREQSVGAAVHVVGEHHVVARPKGEQQGRLGAEAAREREPARAPFEGGEGELERLARRVAAPGVVPHLRLADLGLRVGGGLVDRHVDGPVRSVGVLPGVDRSGLEPQFAPRAFIRHRCLQSVIASRAATASLVPEARRRRRHPHALAPRASPCASRRARARTRPRTSWSHPGSPHSQ